MRRRELIKGLVALPVALSLPWPIEADPQSFEEFVKADRTLRQGKTPWPSERLVIPRGTFPVNPCGKLPVAPKPFHLRDCLVHPDLPNVASSDWVNKNQIILRIKPPIPPGAEITALSIIKLEKGDQILFDGSTFLTTAVVPGRVNHLFYRV